MKIQPAVRKETVHIAAGALILAAVIAAVYALLGRFGPDVLIGCVLGAVWATANFFALGLSVQNATATGDEKRAKLKLQLSYSVRMLLTLGVVALSFAVDAIAWPPVVILCFSPRITIAVMQMLGAYKPEKANEKGE